ncbi:HPF/RaiA family ribosome-associated protein [Legionella jordanis]|uniref:Sigma 54 modulation protein YhbH n=1 Tax=Legionella jordanis TaxID=456 RepID=A0A0W0VCT9_9GAMM|nr:HPF/RaiA family ribosome-associated protein [Legionella jordanis]KTD17670.1 sigma 54 modulation protein YhbH [Legionella jordanis]RMX01542.1 HPF/RaiA family ribosome-associated protein [Legionella jordanis]RMX21537.1 HPF/RaiA family ribosome-associated protein [Legionella jordanis]VEH11401.1 sigma 54 modulation protein YhbH [Legionella jordanis]HAT8715068.1 30S ribosomal protein S30 [Legionella jordanis]
MQLPIQVVFRNMDPSPAAEEKARSLATKLERYFDKIMGCRIVIESPHRHHHKGKLYHVRIDLTVPNAELVVSREPSDHHAHEDVFVAIRDAFDAIKRQLQNYAHQRRGEIKHHEIPNYGRVLEVCPPADYGYIETPDGRQIRFTSNSLIDYDFEKLEVGDRVRFAEVENSEEPVASTVYVERSNHNGG